MAMVLFWTLHVLLQVALVVIDNNITYCGSQNCADPEFRIKAKYAPWVDAMMRFVGPIARQNQYLFASDWESETGEDISDLLRCPVDSIQTELPAQVIGTGPTVRFSAMPEMFETLIYTARRELVITTPYYVPNESMQAGLCACARRGVDTTIVFPAVNDSWVVGAASRSYYDDLLSADPNQLPKRWWTVGPGANGSGTTPLQCLDLFCRL